MAWSMGLLGGAAAVAAAGSFDLLQTETLTTSATSVVFSNLTSAYASDYQHLQLRMVHRAGGATNSNNVYMIFNSASSGYSLHYMYNVGTGVNSGGGANQTSIIAGRLTGANSLANIFGASVVDILDPFETTKNTTVRSLTTANDGTDNTIWVFGGAYLVTTAVDSLTLTSGATNFVTGSRFSLYGLKAA